MNKFTNQRIIQNFSCKPGILWLFVTKSTPDTLYSEALTLTPAGIHFLTLRWNTKEKYTKPQSDGAT